MVLQKTDVYNGCLILTQFAIVGYLFMFSLSPVVHSDDDGYASEI